VLKVYLADATGRPLRRLAGFAKVELAPGEARLVEVPLEWRTIAEWEDDGWSVSAGRYRFVLARDALAEGPSATLELPRRRLEK
jgi:beta-glucosidase